MGALRLLRPTRHRRQIKLLSGQVVASGIDAVRQQLSPQVLEMTAAEARGYVRARAGQVVRRQTRIVLAREGKLPQWGETAIIERATDEVVAQVTGNLLTERLEATRRRAG